MLTYEEILEYINNYKIDNGIVRDKKNNEEVKDEDTILKYKSAVLIFREAKENYQEMIRQFGKTNKDQEWFIRSTMEKYSVNNEVNRYGQNKLVRALLDGNGHYVENISGDDLKESKFSFLVEPKREYGLAYLRLKFREKGLDIDSLKIRQDLSNLKADGYSTVIIDYNIKKYEKNIQSTYVHPRAKDLNELERIRQIAKQDNDEDSYNYATRNIERIVRENPATISNEQWKRMSTEEQISFINVKINEARVLRDRTSFDYWNSKLKELKSGKTQGNKEIEINRLKNRLNNILSSYHKMLADGIIDENELKILLSMMDITITEAYQVKAEVSTEKEIRIITDIINRLEIERQDMKKEESKLTDSARGFK